MIIESRSVKVEKEKKENVAVYSAEDIKELIIKDLEEKGFKVKDVSFTCDYKNKSDSWGMSHFVVTYLKNAIAVIKE